MDWNAETTRIKEKEWFAKHPQYHDIQHVCGIDRLMDTMISLLAEKMVTEVPKLVREMKKVKAEVSKWFAKRCTKQSRSVLSRNLFLHAWRIF